MRELRISPLGNVASIKMLILDNKGVSGDFSAEEVTRQISLHTTKQHPCTIQHTTNCMYQQKAFNLCSIQQCSATQQPCTLYTQQSRSLHSNKLWFSPILIFLSQLNTQPSLQPSLTIVTSNNFQANGKCSQQIPTSLSSPLPSFFLSRHDNQPA